MDISLHKVISIGSFLLLFVPKLEAQHLLTLDECFDKVTENHPLAAQKTVLNEQSDLDIAAIRKEKLPQFDINAQASYQSDVTHLNIDLPNITVTPANKDQYKATLDASLPIYNGGLIAARAKVKESQARVGLQEVEVNLYTLKNKINEVYLSILLLQENHLLLEAKEKQLQSRLDEVSAGVAYGTLLPSTADALLVELLKIKQKYIALDHSKTSLIKRLSLLMGSDLKADVVLETPRVTLTVENNSRRPELTLFDLQKEEIDFSVLQLEKTKLPKLNVFAQGGYGNPGLNMLDNSFTTFYMTGIKLNWNIFDWNRNKTKSKALALNKELIKTQEAAFELNTNLELVQLRSEIEKLEGYLAIDREIIPIRERMVETAVSQLKNGMITSSAYIAEFTDLFEAKSNLNLHKIQLLMQQITYQITNGTYGLN
ncbi:TolC family protein [Maribacter polysaccharolyticus]|uniref:TolC family protein n=1 Tax=Maribacter polysaccharolyticus TaxID=3020831 RepID=UPI00237F17A0|nr:TolC family protein [Maribacter polysaccharolyticus]MDE3742609.1 TolC family protein [Maribacter polysaccharolyticus]